MVRFLIPYTDSARWEYTLVTRSQTCASMEHCAHPLLTGVFWFLLPSYNVTKIATVIWLERNFLTGAKEICRCNKTFQNHHWFARNFTAVQHQQHTRAFKYDNKSIVNTRADTLTKSWTIMLAMSEQTTWHLLCRMSRLWHVASWITTYTTCWQIPNSVPRFRHSA